MSRADAIEGVMDEAMNRRSWASIQRTMRPSTSSARLPSDSEQKHRAGASGGGDALGTKFVLGCAVVAGMILLVGRDAVLPTWLLAAEVLATILGLFLFGSFKYQIHKNALTYGMLLIVVCHLLRAANFGVAPGDCAARLVVLDPTASAFLSRTGRPGPRGHHAVYLGADIFRLRHCSDPIAGRPHFSLLRRNQGKILSTVIAVTAVVALASGVLDGVSMIGLTIRTLVIILLLAAAPIADIRHAVMVCTTVTTICGIWLAYGEPPNLIMKANLYPRLGNAFFLIYCAPIAIACYLVVARHIRKRLRGRQVNLEPWM